MLALGLILALSALPGSATAQSMYDVAGIEIDESAGNEVDAKENGLTRAKSEAFQQLVSRLVVQQGATPPSPPDAAAIERMIADFSLADEKFGGGRYLATLTVRFQPGSVRDYLERNNLVYSETMSGRLVVLPVFEKGETTQLWDETNAWLTAWAGLSDLDAPPVPMVVPLGDIADVSAIGAAQAVRVIPENIDAITGRYGAQGAVVAIARPGESAATGGFQVDVVYLSTAPGWNDVTQTFSISGEAEEPLADVLEKAARTTALSIADVWKNQNAIQPNQARQHLSAIVPLNGLPSWVAVQKQLGRISPVKAVNLAEIAIDHASIDIVYVGSIDQLQRALSQNGLGLINDLETGEVKLVSSRP